MNLIFSSNKNISAWGGGQISAAHLLNHEFKRTRSSIYTQHMEKEVRDPKGKIIRPTVVANNLNIENKEHN